MRSIIDEIAAAERQADEIRLAAAASAREQIALANERAADTLSEQDKAEREKTREALLQAERDGETAAARMREDMAAEARKLCAEAEGRIDVAANYLLQRVQNRA